MVPIQLEMPWFNNCMVYKHDKQRRGYDAEVGCRRVEYCRKVYRESPSASIPLLQATSSPHPCAHLIPITRSKRGLSTHQPQKCVTPKCTGTTGLHQPETPHRNIPHTDRGTCGTILITFSPAPCNTPQHWHLFPWTRTNHGAANVTLSFLNCTGSGVLPMKSPEIWALFTQNTPTDPPKSIIFTLTKCLLLSS